MKELAALLECTQVGKSASKTKHELISQFYNFVTFTRVPSPHNLKCLIKEGKVHLERTVQFVGE